MAKFLVVRFSSIGDIILTTPVVRCLKNQVDEAEIHYLTKSKFAQIVTANPHIKKVHLLDNNFKDLITILRKENYDYIIDLHRNIRTFFIKILLNRIAFSFHKLNLKKWLLVNFKWNTLPDKHIVDRYLKTLHMFSVTRDNKGLDYFIPLSEELDIGKILGNSLQRRIIVVVGGGHCTKQIPENKLVEIINSLKSDVILLGGGQADIRKADRIISEIDKKNVFNLAGKLSLGESASLIKQSDIIITPDTGMMHIAAAFGKNIISIWGNTIPEFGMYPYKPGSKSKIFEIRNLYCRPCSKIGFAKCPEKHFRCMQEHNSEGIVNAVNEIILSK